jgi:hypothetical protein
VTSPDGKINLRIGDETIPNYNTPGPMHPPGPAVAAYASGDVFATRYGQSRFSSVCKNVQVTKAGPMAPLYSKAGQGPVRVTAGAAGFSCTLNGQEMSGYVYAETMLVSGLQESTWYVVQLASFLAPAAQADAAGAMLKHSGESIAYNPEWVKQQNEWVKQATELLHEIAIGILKQGEADRSRFRNQMDAMLKESDYAQDVISGVTYTRDPFTGQTRNVYTGSGATKWTNVHGTVVDSMLSPGPGFQQMTQLQH